MLNSKKRANIKSCAQLEKSLFQVGASELHENNKKAIYDAFNNREIIKVKVNRQDIKDKKITREIGEELAKKKGIELVDVIGTTIILYKEHEDKDKRKNFDY